MRNPPSELTSGIVVHPFLRKIMDLPLFTLGLFNLQVLAFKPNSSKGTYEKTLRVMIIKWKRFTQILCSHFLLFTK